MSGSPVEPSPREASEPVQDALVQDAPVQDAAEQMRAATERLRDKAWMVAPLTSPDSELSADLAEGAPVSDV